MENFSRVLSHMLFDKGYVTETQIEDIRFSLEVVISNALSFLSIVIAGIVFQTSEKTIIFLLMFIVSRMVRDRYHAQTFLSCYVLTVGSYLLGLVVSAWIVPKAQFLFCIYGFVLNYLILYFAETQQCTKATASNDQFVLYFSILNGITGLISIFFPSSISIFMIVTNLIIVVSSYIKAAES